MTCCCAAEHLHVALAYPWFVYQSDAQPSVASDAPTMAAAFTDVTLADVTFAVRLPGNVTLEPVAVTLPGAYRVL